MVADAKCIKMRLRERTPTLRYGKYAGCSVRDVFHRKQYYWQSKVAHYPIKFLGSLSRFIEIDAREQQRLKQILQERKNREIMQSMAAAVSKKYVAKPSDYRFSGEEVIGAGMFKGMSFKDSPYKSNCETLGKVLVGQYRTGFLCDPSLRDLARYVQ